ncbi:MAG TPA: cation-translocating P-type ATPase, partial [Xanthomonadales bacterium]|nr:cation-translocating P-type ATPase [Xanthomonadales bacterium]
VTATGLGSEMGKLGRVLQTISTEQPALQKQLHVLVRNFALVGALAGILIVAMLVIVHDSWLEAMLGGIAVGMSLLPEEFPLVMSVFMAMGAWRISRARVLTRRAAAIETLGATTVLCTDKTGTLTENRMKIAHLVNGQCHWSPEESQALPDRARWTLKTAWFACQDTPTDPMDRAIHQLQKAQRGKTSPASAMPALLKSFGLRPGLLAVTQVRAYEGGCRAYSKGAVEAIVGLCGLPVEQAEAIHLQARELAGRGVRVLGVAQTVVLERSRLDDPGMTPQDLPFEFAGLVGFADPIRAKVPAAVAECRSAGIRVIMITGDYPETAAAIALQAGIQATQVVTGAELESMPDKQLAECVRNTSVFARIQPSQKLRIVQSLKDSGEIVAMTGDGVNDAAAIKSAHIGIAMGGRGTDVAREASSIVLLDDNFESIVATIRLGRRIYDNLRKAIEFIIAVHIPIAGLALLPLLMGLPLILTPILIAFLEMIIDPACSIVLEAEQEEDDVMQRPPRRPDSSLLQPQRIGWAIFQGSVALAILLAILLFTADAGFAEDDIRALTFVSLVLINMGLILVNRSFKSSLVNAFLKPNYALGILFSLVLVLLGLVVYWDPAQQLFQFGQLHLHDLGICIAVGISSLVLLELGKSTWFRNVKPNGG